MTKKRKSGGMSAGGAIAFALIVLLGIFALLGARPASYEPRVQQPTPEIDILAPRETIAPAPEPTPIPTPAPTPEPTAEPTPRTARIRVAGDLVIHANILESARRTGEYDFSDMFANIAESLSDADYTVANVDGVLCGDSKKKYSGYPNFNTPPMLARALMDAGVDMLTLANNHALDMYFDGFKKAMDNLDEMGMAQVGGARSPGERAQPVIKEINGIKVGFLSYTESANRMEKHCDAGAREYGVIFLADAEFASDISAMRQAGADSVVIFAHWGDEYESRPNSRQRAWAQEMAEAGADVIVGGHPHTVQPAYWIETARGKTLVMYSVGNFLADKRNEKTDAGLIFEFTLDESGSVLSAGYVPTYICRTSDSPYLYRIVASGEYLTSAPSGMSAKVHKRVIAAWDYVTSLMGTEVASPLIK